MASSVRVIVHSGRHGLEPAADYYGEFLWEPSPAGEMNLNKSDIVKINDAGFWTPGEPEPWLLPNETEYLDHIKEA